MNLDKTPAPRRPINARYGDGPWRDEPDRDEWRDPATGLPCLIVRGPVFGQWCGYVAVPPGHPLHGTDKDDMPDEVQCVAHEGVTYASACQEGAEGTGICHVPQPGEPPDVWWIGFDCMHFGDLVPGMLASIGYSFPGDVYRDVNYVKTVCTSLADVLGRIGSPLPASSAATAGVDPGWCTGSTPAPTGRGTHRSAGACADASPT